MKSRTLLAGIALLSLYSFASAQTTSPQLPVTQPRAEPVKTGEVAPDFTLEDFRVESEQPRKVTLSLSKGQANVVLVFYRGYW